jgi:hypothetical protein
LIRRLGMMKAERTKHEHIWRACIEVCYPELAEGLNGDQVDASTAQTKKAEQMDSTATDSVRMLASQVMGGMTPANAVWPAFDVGDETDEEQRWLDHAGERVWEGIHGANYDAAKFEALLFVMCAGWMVLFIDEDGDALTFQQFPIGQCYLAASRPGGRIDTLFRCFKLTAEQAVATYGDKLSAKVHDDARQKPDTMHEFLHAVYPRTEYTPGSKLPRNLPFASCHVEISTKQLVRESGYHEQPFVAPRWTQIPGSPYATGPMSAALPTVRRLNELLKLETVALARAAAGVYVAADDGVLNPRTVRVRGGTVIVANDVNSIKELPTGANFNVTFTKADEMRAEIRRVLMADQLQPQDGPAMTATEVHVRVALIRQLLGPLYGRFQAEDLAPTVERVFGLMYRRGRPELGGRPGPVDIDDMPESLTNTKYRVRFDNPLARAQRLEEVTAIERTVVLAGTMAQQGKPEVLDLIDGDESLRLAAKGLGAPAAMLRDEKALAVFRKQREQAQDDAADAEQAQQVQTMAVEAALKQPAAA